jgi:BMFP domain-containing protein YqiC
MTQTLLTIFIPTLTVLVGILLNRSDYSKLDARMSSMEARLDGRMTALEGRFHADMMMVIGKLTELEVRVAKLETQRQ